MNDEYLRIADFRNYKFGGTRSVEFLLFSFCAPVADSANGAVPGKEVNQAENDDEESGGFKGEGWGVEETGGKS